MKYFIFLILILILNSCQDRVVDKLRPETLDFLEKQEQARCYCLDKHIDHFMLKMEEGIVFMKKLPEQYDLKNLSPKDKVIIQGGLGGFEGAMIGLMNCIRSEMEKSYQSDQLTQMLIAEDFRVVLALDSAKTANEKMERMYIPSLEIMEQLCPEHKKAIIKLQEFLKVAEILPPELQ